MFTEKQITAVKYLITASRDGYALSRQIMCLLVDHSERLTKEVCVALLEGDQGFTSREINDVAHGVSILTSARGGTYVDQIMILMGTAFHFRTLCVREESGLMRCTFWLSEKPFSEKARIVHVTRATLAAALEKSALYPALER